MSDIIFDRSARSIFARCQAIVVFRRLLYRLEMRNFSSHVEKYFTRSQHFATLEENFVSPRGHVISSIYIAMFILLYYDAEMIL